MEVLLFILLAVGIIAVVMAASNRPQRRRPSPRYTADDVPRPADVVLEDNGIGWIRSLDITGRYEKSRNGRYAVIFDSGHGEQFRDQEGRVSTRWNAGAIALVGNGKVIFTEDCSSPGTVAVSNNGNFVICETDTTGELKTGVHAYSMKTGQKTSSVIQALPNCAGISDDGRYVAVQFCNSRNEDSGKLMLWDVDRRERIANFEPETGWPDKIDFRVSEREIVLEYEKVGRRRQYRYSFDGAFLDHERHRREEVEDASVSQMIYIIRRRFKDAPQGDLPGLLALMDDTLSRSFAGELGSLASAHRLKGEIHEALGERQPAIAAYERALDLNPKVGVKNRLKRLKKQQGT